jgi:hypothetical protein
VKSEKVYQVVTIDYNQSMQNQRKRVRLARILSVILITAVLAGCSFQRESPLFETPTSQPATVSPSATIVWFPATSTPTRQVTIQPSATPDSSIQYGNLIIDDQFRTPADWTKGSFADGNIEFSENALNLAVASPDGTLVSLRADTFANDFYLEASVTASLCTPPDTFGVVFWATNDRNYYRAAFNCSGQFRLEKVSNGRVSALSDWAASSQAVRTPGLPVRVGLWVGRGLVRLYLNDEFQSSQTLAPTAGGIGFFASSNGYTAVTTQFTDMQLYKVTSDDYPPTATPTVRTTNTGVPTVPTP